MGIYVSTISEGVSVEVFTGDVNNATLFVYSVIYVLYMVAP